MLTILFCQTSIAQNTQKDNQSITITIETKDKAGNKSVRKIVKENENLSETEIQKMVDELIKENDGKDVKIDVNVEEQKAVKSDADNPNSKVIIKRKKLDNGDADDIKIIVDGEEIKLDGDSSKNKVIIIEGDESKTFRDLSPKDFFKNLDIKLDTLLKGMDMKIEDLQFMARMPFLGITSSEQTSDKGVVVGEIVPGSAAEKAGLMPGDIITSIAGTKLSDFEQLTQEIKKHKPQEDVTITYQRAGVENTVTAKLGQKEGNQFRFPGGTFDFDDLKWEGDNNPQIRKFKMNPDFRINDSEDSRKAQLGVMVENNNDDGVVITNVIEGTAAYHGGLRKGDTIQKINKKRITSADQLVETINSMSPGDEIKIDFTRNGKKKSAELVLGKRKVNNDFGFGPETNNKTRKTYIFKNGEKDLSFDSDAPELKLENLEIFPNPSEGKLNIKFSAPAKDEVTIKILNVEGKEVFKDNLNSSTGQFEKTIELKNNKSGVYIIRIEQDGKMTTEKIILNK